MRPVLDLNVPFRPLRHYTGTSGTLMPVNMGYMSCNTFNYILYTTTSVITCD